MLIVTSVILALMPQGSFAEIGGPEPQLSRLSFTSSLPQPDVLWSYKVDHDITDVAVGELNGDGKQDVAAIDFRPFDATLFALRGEGNGSGNGSTLWTKTFDGFSVAVGDIDGDGLNEVISHQYPATIAAFENDGTPKWQYSTGGEVKDIEIGDIDGNGKKDVVACNNFNGPGAVYAIDGITGLNIPNWPVVNVGEEYMDVAVGQLDGVGGMDVAAIGSGQPNSLFAYSSTGALLWSRNISGRTLEIGDVNGDGANEVVAGTDDGRVLVYKGTNGNLLYTFSPVVSSPVTDVELGDLDGNPANGVEVACIYSGSPTPDTLFAVDIDNPSKQIMWSYDMSWDTPYYGESLAIGDVDRDYKNEVIACSSVVDHGVYAFDGLDNNGDGIGDLVWSPYMLSGSGLIITDLEIGDLDGDGDNDVVVGTSKFQQPDTTWSSLIIALTARENKAVTATGTAYFDSDPSTLENLVPINENTLPSAGKPNWNYANGFFSFDIAGLHNGETATITVTLPVNAPVGTKWVKYQNGQWLVLPIGDDDGDNIITFQLKDGGTGDEDGTANGRIVDRGSGFSPSGNTRNIKVLRY
jgi:hypothetical protein